MSTTNRSEGTGSRHFNRGDIYWIQPEEGTSLGNHPHPYVILQEDLFNHSRVRSVVVCALTTNMRQANELGNILLDAGEANLPRQSIVVVSKLSAVEKSKLGEYVGSLSAERVDQIMAGIRFQQLTFFNRS